MNNYDKLYTILAGLMLILGPGLIVCAALLAAAGIGTTTGRWYDNWLEGILLALGFMLQLIGLLALCRRIGATRPVLGIVITLTSVLGTTGPIFPAAAARLVRRRASLGHHRGAARRGAWLHRRDDGRQPAHNTLHPVLLSKLFSDGFRPVADTNWAAVCAHAVGARRDFVSDRANLFCGEYASLHRCSNGLVAGAGTTGGRDAAQRCKFWHAGCRSKFRKLIVRLVS